MEEVALDAVADHETSLPIRLHSRRRHPLRLHHRLPKALPSRDVLQEFLKAYWHLRPRMYRRPTFARRAVANPPKYSVRVVKDGGKARIFRHSESGNEIGIGTEQIPQRRGLPYDTFGGVQYAIQDTERRRKRARMSHETFQNRRGTVK